VRIVFSCEAAARLSFTGMDTAEDASDQSAKATPTRGSKVEQDTSEYVSQPRWLGRGECPSE
jgi:hypothetical protein